MIISFTDKNVGGFIFGQMTATGYKKIVLLDQDDPEKGWKAGDMIIYNMSDVPCFRMQPLISGISYSREGVGTTETFQGKTNRKRSKRYR